MSIDIEITGDGIMRLADATAALGDRRNAYTAFRRGLNKAGQMAYTQVKREVAKQIGASQAKVVRYGGLKRIPATGQLLETRIIARGGHIPLNDFKARQTRSGVSAAPWARRVVFGGTFIVGSIGGNVFKRIGPSRLPIEKLWGPSVPKEVVKDRSREAFESTARRVLAPEINRQVRLLAGGAAT